MKNQGGVDESGIQSKRLKKIVNKMSSFSADSGALSAQLQQEQKEEENQPILKTSENSKDHIDNIQNESMFQLFDDGDDDDIDSAILNVPLDQLPSSPSPSSFSTVETGYSSKSNTKRGNVVSPSTSLQTRASLLNKARTGNSIKSNRLRDYGGSSSASQTRLNNPASTLPYIDDTDVPLTRTRLSSRTSNQTSSSSSATATVSQNEHVQAMKVANLMKAAEESLKPTTPYIAMRNVNSLVWNRMRGKSKRIKGATGGRRGAGGSSKRLKTTTSLLEQVNSAKEATTAKSSVQSSDSDSDY